MNAPERAPIVLPADAPIDWFSQSRRVVNGRPDARYGWADAAGGACIVKCLDVGLGPSVAGLLDHERRVLSHLQSRGAPVPEPVPCDDPAWLVTRFAGLSMRVLQQRADSTRQFPFASRLAAWVHLLHRAEAFVQAGALPLDLWAGNVVVPLSAGRCGQLVLQDVRLIDHAHTVVIGMNMRRPVWIDRRMPRVAPELRGLLARDQEALTSLFNLRGAPMPQTTAAVRDERGLSAELWAGYDADQHLQLALDNGELDVAAAIQFAVGVAIEAGLAFAPASLHAPLLSVVARMTAEQPRQRHPALADAAAALKCLLPALPRVGHHTYPPVGAADLAPCKEPAAPTRTCAATGACPLRSAGQSVGDTLRAGDVPPARLGGWPVRCASLLAGWRAAGADVASGTRRLARSLTTTMTWPWLCGCLGIGALLGPWIG